MCFISQFNKVLLNKKAYYRSVLLQSQLEIWSNVVVPDWQRGWIELW